MRFIKAAILILLIFAVQCSPANHYDTIIRGGIIVDGTGNPPYKADIGIIYNKIAAIGVDSVATAGRIIDAEGMYVAPGFIDIHSKSQFELLADGRAESKLRQGITTVIMGEDESPGPILKNSAGYSDRKIRAYSLKRDWNFLYEYLDKLDANGIAVNVGSLVGAWQARRSVAGFTWKQSIDQQSTQLASIMEMEIQGGALGFSVGYAGIAERYLNTTVFAYKAQEYGCLFASRLRYENEDVLYSVSEIKKLLRDMSLNFEILELKIESGNNDITNKEFLDSIESLRNSYKDQGCDVSACIIPFPMYLGTLSEIIPLIYKRESWELLLLNLKSDVKRREIEKILLDNAGDWDALHEYLNGIRIVEAFKEENKQYVGRTLFEITVDSRKPMDKIAEIIISEPSDVTVQFETLDEAFIREAIQRPWVKLCTGAPAIFEKSNNSERGYSVLYYVAFPGAIRKYVKDDPIFNIEEIICKMTSMNADKLNITNRGRLVEGKRADIVIFDLDSITPVTSIMVDSGFDTGVRYVFVNGIMVYDNGHLSDKRPGEIIRGPGKR